MSEQEEEIWLQGERAAYSRILSVALGGIDRADPQWDKARLESEREAAIAVLRSLCEDFGDNDWEPNLYLADIIDKHLGKHLHASDE